MKNVIYLITAKALDSSILDFKFIAILVILAVSVVVVCCLFARSEKFKLKNKANVTVDESYKIPTIVSVKEKNK